MIVHNLNLTPNMTVCESGTGSGAMSHCILRSIAPHGKLHTYEFNKIRAEKARVEFEGHGLGHLVEVHHRDVCGKMALLKKDEGEQSETIESNNKYALDDGKGGFQLGESVAHAIFLDLPEPWLAVPHAAFTLKASGRICSYSPCMEQTQRTVVALKQCGFHSIQTVEARLKEYYVDEIEMVAPPTALSEMPTQEGTSMEKERHVSGGVMEKQSGLDTETEVDIVPVHQEKKRKICARPFSQMRGHTAFLTFATAGSYTLPKSDSD
jgi:tRNA (adenine57-N1/adenine58-N1)-methyltransferase